MKRNKKLYDLKLFRIHPWQSKQIKKDAKIRKISESEVVRQELYKDIF